MPGPSHCKLYVYKIKITQKFRRLGLPLIVIFPLADRKGAYNNGCGRYCGATPVR
jgi:hypothetical protein